MSVMDKYEKAIREKVFRSDILTAGEWVYLVGLMQVAKEHEEAVKALEQAKQTGHQSFTIAHAHQERSERVVAGLRALIDAVHAGDPKRELLVRVGDILRDANAPGAVQQSPKTEG